jgi:tRNA modification GTPase
VAAGARLAEPGEFTGRAFLAGAMDLTAVEGVAAMIQAGSDAELRAAEQLLHGALARRTQRLQDELVDLLALIEASIDFVEEPIDFVSTEQANDRLHALVREIDGIVAESVPAERLDPHIRITLYGPTNAGKSMLFNRLTGLDRTICSPTAGTTRDVVAAPMRIGDGDVWLEDTAGIAQAGSTRPHLGQDHALHAAMTCDVVVYVIDGTDCRLDDLDAKNVPFERDRTLFVINKADVASDAMIAPIRSVLEGAGFAAVVLSAVTGHGCDFFCDRLCEILGRKLVNSAAQRLTLNVRHRAALFFAMDAFRRAQAVLQRSTRVADVAELLAVELREATQQLGSVVGAVTTDELLGRIFSRFCIGK